MEAINLLAIIAGGITSLTIVIGATITVSKPVRRWIVKKISNIAHKEAAEEGKELLEKVYVKLNEIGDELGGIKVELEELKKDIQLLKGSNREQLKNFIKNVYSKRMRRQSIKQYDKEVIIEFYHFYKEMGGNNVIDRLYADIMTWRVEGEDNE